MSVHSWLGLWVPRKQRAPKIQQPRYRRACCGELRPLESDDDLAAFFTWREPRYISKSLTVQYDNILYMIEDNELSRSAIGKYIEVWHYPDGQKELRLNGTLLPYSTYDRLQEIDQGAIVDKDVVLYSRFLYA